MYSTDRLILLPMTAELAYGVFNGYESDPVTYENEADIRPFVYSEKWVDEHLEGQKALGHILFAIMLNECPIGEVKLHKISQRQKKCELTIHIKNDSYRNLGYGTEALKQAVEYVRETLRLDVIETHIISKNMRARRAFKKAGFVEAFHHFGVVYLEKELNKSYIMKPFKIAPMTRELYHEFYRGYRTDIPMKGFKYLYRPYIYDAEGVDSIYSFCEALERLMFAIIVDDSVVGNIELFRIDYDEGYGYISCEMQSKDYKNRGYGKEATIRMLKYARQKLGLKKLLCDVPEENTHAAHVLEKIGFTATGTLSKYITYEILL